MTVVGRRIPLVSLSLAAHAAIAAGVLISGLWQLERLTPARRPLDLTVSPPPPPPGGGTDAAPAAAFVRKRARPVTTAIVQPATATRPLEPASAAGSGAGSGSGGSGTGAGSGDGIGSGSGGDGPCATPPCGPGEGPDSTAEPPRLVPPPVLRGLRVAGSTQIHPPAAVKLAILRDGKTRVTATLKLCVGSAGEVASLSVVASSGYSGYDDALAHAVRAWRYRPYMIGGRAVTVCGTVTFIYEIQ